MVPDHIFRFYSASEMATQLRTLPKRSATYLVLIRGGDRLLELAGYFSIHDRLPYQCRGFSHLYTGSGEEWGNRVRHHLAGNAVKSNFRCTLQALERACRAISHSGIGPWTGAGDERLTRWLLRNALIGVCECGDPRTLEKVVLESTPSPLNIDQRKWDPFGRRLMEIRAKSLTSGRARG